MLVTIIVILLALWLIGLVTANTFGGILHVLLAIALVIFFISLSREEKLRNSNKHTAKNVLKIEGQDVVVREDTARSYRGVMWGLATMGICLAILAVLFLGVFWIGK